MGSGVLVGDPAQLCSPLRSRGGRGHPGHVTQGIGSAGAMLTVRHEVSLVKMEYLSVEGWGLRGLTVRSQVKREKRLRKQCWE